MDADAARRRVFVLDASAAVADAIADVIRRSDHFELVGVTTRAGEPTIRQVRERHPDVVLVDYRLGGGALVGQLRVSAPTAQLLVSSVRARASERDDSLAAGANGYFEKRDGIAHLLRVMSGTTTPAGSSGAASDADARITEPARRTAGGRRRATRP